jgi:tetratricopeptide (TPR) repeat protein
LDDDKPFDAVESYLCETEPEPSTQWTTVSLVTAMLGIISHGPEFEKPTPEARLTAFKAAAEELSRRGLDAVALARYGMSREVATPLLAAILVRALFDEDPPINGVDIDRWCEVLDLRPPPARNIKKLTPEVGDWVDDVVSSVTPRLYQWIASASIDELVNLTPPTREVLVSLSAGEPLDRDLREQYRWAVDHFAKTFFREWKTPSLHSELRWLDGYILPPCPNELMLDRKVPREKITEEIARRTVYDNDNLGSGESLVSEMSRHALKLLRQGRYREAAAVFEFGVQQRPEDPEVRNNLGFCLIPIEPREALEHLRAAANMAYEPSATNTYNQMCCYVLIGRSRAALNIADLESKKSPHQPMAVLLWNPTSDGGWELLDSDDPFKSVVKFATEIARIEGWKDQEEYWVAIEARQGESPAELTDRQSEQSKESQQASG